MCGVKYECRAGIELLARANGWKRYEFGTDVDAVGTRMIMSADDEFYLIPSLVSDDGKYLVSVVHDMSFLDSDIKALMAKHPEAASLGRICKNVAERFDLILGNIGILPIRARTVFAVARAVGLIIRIKEDQIHLACTADEGRSHEICYSVKGVVIEIVEIMIALHHEHGHGAVADDLCHARKVLDVVGTADASVYHVSEADRKINAEIIKINEKLLQLTE